MVRERPGARDGRFSKLILRRLRVRRSLRIPLACKFNPITGGLPGEVMLRWYKETDRPCILQFKVKKRRAECMRSLKIVT